MKLLGKNKDGARAGSRVGSPVDSIDSLLRAYVSRPGNRVCSEFDADLANAYIERSLTPSSRSHYEEHLSECGPCRKNVTVLSRLAEAESRPLISARADTRLGGRQIFGVTSWPRWAMAATAVIVLAISLPLLLTRKASRVDQEASHAVSESQALDNTQAINRSPEMSSAPAAKQAAANASAPAEPKPSEKRQTDTVSANAPAPGQQPSGSAGAASGGKLEAKKEPAAVDQVQAKSGGQQPSEVAAGQAQQEKRSDKDDALAARQQQPSKDAADTKSRSNEQDQQNAKEKARVAESAATPPPPAAPGAKVTRSRRSSAIRALRDSSAAEAVRPTEKKIGGKKFSLKDDTWTDKEFDPDKDLPTVTIIRDSNVYNELLGKQTGLKPYLTAFAGTERAIVVYKGTVYKLIPQQSNQ